MTDAYDARLARTPNIHDLRHTHASWLIHEGVSLFTIARRLGHASTSTTEKCYGHLMPQALREAAHAMERSERLLREQRDTSCDPQIVTSQLEAMFPARNTAASNQGRFTLRLV